MTMNRRGILAVVSGFSGAGKGTVTRRLIEKYHCYALSVSVTSRKPRPGETEGEAYYFRTREEIEKMIRDGDLIEHAEYVGNYYGTPRSYVEQKLDQGTDVILEIEMQGAASVRKLFPECVLIFVTPPDFDELTYRLHGRGSESEEVIAKRMKRAVTECGYVKDYDYVVINETGKVEECVDRIHALIQSEHLRTARNMEFVQALGNKAERS
jgi:guanylate kinase